MTYSSYPSAVSITPEHVYKKAPITTIMISTINPNLFDQRPTCLGQFYPRDSAARVVKAPIKGYTMDSMKTDMMLWARATPERILASFNKPMK